MIVPMKKVQIAVFKEDFDKVIKSLQRFELMMIINKEGGDASISLDLNEALQQRVTKTLALVKKYEEKKPLFDYQVADYNEFKEVSKESLDLLEKLEKFTSRNDEIKQIIKGKNETLENLKLWLELEYLPEEVKDTKYAKTYIGYVPSRSLERFTEEAKKDGFDYQVYGKNSQFAAVMVFCYYEDNDSLQELLKKYEFTDFTLPKIDCKIKEYYDKIIKEIDELNDEYIANLNTIKEYVKRSDELRVLSDQILTQEEINNVRCDVTEETKVIEGWVRDYEKDQVEKAIKEVTDDYILEITDPEDGDAVPTYTKNKKFPSQFEQVTDMFSKPNYHEVDPNPVMSVWYWFLFGMMMGDAGYGLLMIVAAFIFRKLAKPKGNTLKLVNIIMYSGVPTIFWGIIFGSYFGFNPQTDFGISWWWYWFAPMDNPIKMLIVSVAVGALHLITGLIVKCVICVREKDYIELFSKNLSWILILSGIGLYFISNMAGIICAGLGVALILLFAGARKKSIFGKAFFGILGLYDVTSYLGDVLSYSRIMALAMSSAAVAMVMNTLANMVGGSVVGMFAAALIFVAGHIFNIVLGLLSAYVHDARLQYIEFFGKFFEGGGIDFKPLAIKTKYLKDVINTK